MFLEGLYNSKRFQVEVSLDGNKWCALIGGDLQEGVAGFGDTPMLALCALCQELNAYELAKQDPSTEEK